MGNKFDMISANPSGSINNLNLLNETFHVFSKSPASDVTTLGGARLKSGHTTTTSDVWADEIPAFFSAANQAKFDLFSTLAVKDDLCIFGGEVYQHNGTQFVSLGSEAEVLVDGATFKKNDKDVIKYHKNRTAINLTADNNNGDGSNNLSAKIYDAATGSTNFVSQFISSTDKMVAGVPSLAYDATVIAGGVKLAEGLTNDNDYICNAYAGVIQFNKARSSGVTVSAWEYIGDKLTTSISSIRQSIKDISDVTLKGVVASVTADENTAQKAGITVDNSVSTTPVIKFTAGSVAANETKLVTGGAVKTYVDTTALAEGGSIAEYIKTYVSQNAKVSVNGQSATTITVAGTGASSSDLVKIAVAEDKTVTDKIGLTITATADVATVTDGVADSNDKLVTAGGAKDIAEKAISTAITEEDGAINNAIDSAISDATLADGQQIATTTDTSKLVTVEQVKEYVTENAQVTVTVGETDVTSTGFEFAGSTGTDVSVGAAMDSNGKVTYSATLSKATVDATTGAITNGSLAVSATDAKTIADKAIANSLIGDTDGTIGKAIADAQTAADGKVADVTVDDISIVSGDAGSKVAALTTTKVAAITPNVDSASTALATEASVAKALASITSVGVSYQVLAEGQKHTSITAPVNGRIYLEKDTTNADAGVYIEWMYTNESGWEKIGSTKTDHSSYASTITVNGSPKNVTDSAVDLGALVSSVADGTVTGTVSASGKLTLTVDTEALVENGSIKASVTDANALVKAADALEAIKLAKPDNYVKSVTGYTTNGTQVTTTQGAAVKIVDGRGTSVTGNELQGTNDLWGTTVTMDASGVITVDHKYLTNPKGEMAWLENVKAVQDNKAYSEITTDADGKFTEVVVDSVVANIQTEMIKDGSYMFYDTSLASFSGDLSNLVNGSAMFASTSLESFSGDLSNLVYGGSMFYNTPLTSFSGDLSNLVDGSSMFFYNSLTSFSGDLSSLINGSYMFFYTPLESFSGDLSSLVDGSFMFRSTSLESFSGDLSSLVDGRSMFSNTSTLTSFDGDLSSLLNGQSMFAKTALTSFTGDLSSLVNGSSMFHNASLDTESVECIADTIRNVKDNSDFTDTNTDGYGYPAYAITGSDGKTYTVTKQIGIGIANETPNEVENAAFWTMVNEKGWSVYVNGSETVYHPTEPAALDENGEEVATPIPFWAKPVETDEEHAEYVGEDGKFYNVVGAQFIYVSDPETYGQFTSLEDAVANMRLTKIEKKDQIENKA